MSHPKPLRAEGLLVDCRREMPTVAWRRASRHTVTGQVYWLEVSVRRGTDGTWRVTAGHLGRVASARGSEMRAVVDELLVGFDIGWTEHEAGDGQ